MKLRLFEKRFAVVILAAMFFIAVPLLGQQVVNTRTLQGYTTIQAAINAASDGDTLLVAPATYQENVTVNKSVAIVGDQGRTPIVDGGTSGDVFTVTADRAMIKFLTIKSRVNVNYACVKITGDNVNVIGNNILDCFYGIHAASGADGTRIKENDLTNAEFGAIKIESNNNVVYSNHVHDIYRGIWVWGNVTRNVLCNNTVTGFENEGILTTSSDSWLYSNVVVGDNNPLTGEFGIMLMSATNNTVTANTVRECKHGLFLVNGANGNRIHHNNFIDNTCHAVIETVLSLSVNTVWHNGHGGNYFSGHTGTDANNDGIIDSTPYTVPDAYCNGQQDQDPYPLVGIWGPVPGNVDGSPDGLITMSDLTYFIAYLFQNGNNDPVPPCVGDVNGDGIVYDDDTVYGDIDYLVDYMYSSGPAPVANCCFFLVLPKYFN